MGRKRLIPAVYEIDRNPSKKKRQAINHDANSSFTISNESDFENDLLQKGKDPMTSTPKKDKSKSNTNVKTDNICNQEVYETHNTSANNTSMNSLESILSETSDTDLANLFLYVQRKGRISDSSFNIVLKLMRYICPTVPFTSVKALHKTAIDSPFLDEMYSKITSVCNGCQIINLKTCENRICNFFKKRSSEFVTFNFLKQLELIIGQYGSKIISFVENTGNETRLLDDLTTGSHYRRNVRPNPDNFLLKINLLVNADGARLRHCRSGEAWPITAVIVELPPNIRYNYKNTVLLGLWIGNRKPTWDVFCAQMIDKLKAASIFGFFVEINGVQYSTSVKILATVMDMPARCSFYNVKQFNGKFGCMECRHPGRTYDSNKLIRCYPYFKAADKDDRFYEAAWFNSTNNHAIFGIRKKPAFAHLLNPGCQNPLDIMHLLYLGVCRQILSCLCGVGEKVAWSLTRKEIRHADEEVICLLPQDGQRTIKPLEELKQWKAIEVKNFSLYVLFPLVENKFRATNPGFAKWIQVLVNICHSVNSENLTMDDVDEIQSNIHFFLKKASLYLPENKLGINFHGLMHLPKYIRLYGPCHKFSLFAFENAIGMYSRLITSSRGSLLQLSRRYIHEKMSSDWAEQQTRKSSKLSSIVNQLSTLSTKRRLPTINYQLTFPNEIEKSFLENRFHVLEAEIRSLTCARKDRQTFLCETRSKKLKCCNNYAVLDNGTFVTIKRIFQFRSTTFVTSVKIETTVNSINFFEITNVANKEIVFDLCSIRNMCAFVHIFGKNYLCPIIIGYEHG